MTRRNLFILLGAIAFLVIGVAIGYASWLQFPYLFGRIILGLLWLGASAWILWFAFRLAVHGWRRAAVVLLGVLAAIGFFIVCTAGYAMFNWQFRERIRVYALTHAPRAQEATLGVYPDNTEFLYADMVLYDYQGQRVLFPGNQETKFVNVFGNGWFSAGEIHDGTLTLSQDKYYTSLWWVFANVDLFNLISSV